MNNLIYSLNGTVPIFAVMVLGYLLKRTMLTEEFVSVANKFVFCVALPVMVFEDLRTADISGKFDWRLSHFVLLLLY